MVPYKTQDLNETPDHHPTSEPNSTPTYIPYPKPNQHHKPTTNPNPDIDTDTDNIQTEALYNKLVGNDENLTDDETDIDLNMNDSISLDEIDELETAYNNKTPKLDNKKNSRNTLDPNTLTPTHTTTHTTHNSDSDFVDIPPHLITSFRILYTLKTKLNNQQTNLEHLQEHKKAKTVPTGLQIHHKNKFHMTDKTLKERWENTLSDASLALLDIIIEHHQQSIEDIKNKIQHKTTQIQTKCDKTTAERIIHKTDLVYLKHTERSIHKISKTTEKT